MFTPSHEALALNYKRTLEGFRLNPEPRRAHHILLRPRACHPERSEGSALSSFNFELSTLDLRLHCPVSVLRPPLAVGCQLLAVSSRATPFFATPACSLQPIENTATLSPVSATLTSRVKPKSCVCHSYRKHRGWGMPTFLASVSSSNHDFNSNSHGITSFAHPHRLTPIESHLCKKQGVGAL
jgi:hypothetical protein